MAAAKERKTNRPGGSTSCPAGPKKEGDRDRVDPKTLSLDERIAKALNHPMRTEILAMLADRGPLSPRELSDLVDDWSLSNVSYHTRELRKFGCIEVADREQVRGAMKTRYRAITRMLLDRENWDRLDIETRNGISLNAVREVIDRAAGAIEADTFDKRTDRAVITMKMDGDEQAWSEATEIVREAYERLSEVEAEAANRSGEKFRMTVSLLAYESPRS
jgi:DNA-binding transcriptional ArsR family regulator